MDILFHSMLMKYGFLIGGIVLLLIGIIFASGRLKMQTVILGIAGVAIGLLCIFGGGNVYECIQDRSPASFPRITYGQVIDKYIPNAVWSSTVIEDAVIVQVDGTFEYEGDSETICIQFEYDDAGTLNEVTENSSFHADFVGIGEDVETSDIDPDAFFDMLFSEYDAEE